MALAAAQRAVLLDPESASSRRRIDHDGKPDEGAAELATALRINPSHADAWVFLGQLKAFEGTPAEGIDYVRTALRLNSHPHTRIDTKTRSKHSGMRQSTGLARVVSWPRVLRGLDACRRLRRKRGNSSALIRISRSSTGQAHNRCGTRRIGSISLRGTFRPACHNETGPVLPATPFHRVWDLILLNVRPTTLADANAIWSIFKPTLRAGESYALPRNWSRSDSLAYWFSPHHEVFVAEDEGLVIGTYYLRAN
jgi:hypothetical protein